MNRPAPIIAGILAAILLLFGAYMGAYYGLVTRTPFPTGGGWSHEVVNGVEHTIHTTDDDIGYFARYRFGGGAAQRVFLPANELDRLIRPSYWATVSGLPQRTIKAESFDETAETWFKEPDIQIYEPASFSVESSNR